MYHVYILYSISVNGYYIGITSNIENRISAHNNKIFIKGYTKKADDWELYYAIDCYSINQALKIEKHIKRMKSKEYICNQKNILKWQKNYYCYIFNKCVSGSSYSYRNQVVPFKSLIFRLFLFNDFNKKNTQNNQDDT